MIGINNINTSETYQIDATNLEQLSKQDQIDLYNRGYRFINTTNNETEVLLKLSSNGDLQFIKSNQDTTNLLDNPDFSIA